MGLFFLGVMEFSGLLFFFLSLSLSRSWDWLDPPFLFVFYSSFYFSFRLLFLRRYSFRSGSMVLYDVKSYVRLVLIPGDERV